MEAERQWAEARKEILGESSEDEGGENKETGEGGEGQEGGAEADAEEDDEGGAEEAPTEIISDQTTTELINLKKAIYLTIMSSLDFEECAHKLLKMKLKEGQEVFI